MGKSLKSTGEAEMALDTTSTKPNLQGDRLNFLLLLLLYIMQGINFGVSVSALPMILQSKKIVTYEDQALFSLALWPNSMKILWAPIVDSIYIQRVGRRKSWLLPIQFSMGINLLYLAVNINEWLPETGKPNMESLTCVFLILNLFASTLDIVYSGWAVTMLKKANASYSSASKSSGMAIGILIGSAVPILLSSEKFCNNHLRSSPGTGGVVTLERFFILWGFSLIVLTILIGIFKKEKKVKLESSFVQSNIVHNYKLLWDILKLSNARVLLIALFTMQIGNTAMRNSFTNLKLIDAGVPEDNLMLLTIAMFAVKILTPLAISKYTSGPNPMSLCMKAMLIRLLWSLTLIPFIHYTPMLIKRDNKIVDVPIYYYLILGFLYAVNDALTYYMLVTITTFFTRISDSHYSGTYMTLLNTVTNFGVSWSSSLGLKVIDYLAINCSSTIILKNLYNENEDHCPITVDGFYVEVILCVIIGFNWYGVFKNTLEKFQIQNPFDKPICFNQPDKSNTVEVSNAVDS